VRLPPAGNPWAKGSRTSEWQQYGFAGLVWSTYDLGCFPDWVSALRTMLASMELGAARTVVAIDITVHDWAASDGWMSMLGPLVTEGTRVVHQDLFTPWAGVSLLLLALVLLARAHRGNFGSAVTAFLWALMVLALVAGVTAYPTWASRQVTGLMAGTINAMDAGFVGQRSEAAAADSHASLLVSAVLYRQWLAGEFGDATSPQARRFGPPLFQAQALTWRQAAEGQSQLAATENAKEKQWMAIASQIKSADPALYPYLQGKQGSRLGIGALTLADSVIVCGFDIFASLVIVVAELLLLLVTVMLPALALVGLHHDTRFAITAMFSRVAGRVASAILYAVAAGLNVRASEFLLSQGNQAAKVTGFPPAGFTTMLLQLMLTIALFWAVRRVRAGRLVPAAVMYGGMYAAMLAWNVRPRGGPPPAAADDAPGGAAPAGPAAPPPPPPGPAGPPLDGGPRPSDGHGPEPPGGAPPGGPGTGRRPRWPNTDGWANWPPPQVGPDAIRPPDSAGPYTRPPWAGGGDTSTGLLPSPPPDALPAETAGGPAGGSPSAGAWPGWPDDGGGEGVYLGAPRHSDAAGAPAPPPPDPDGSGQLYRGSWALGDDFAGGTGEGHDQ
jgi:hypothetical protein